MRSLRRVDRLNHRFTRAASRWGRTPNRATKSKAMRAVRRYTVASRRRQRGVRRANPWR